MMLPWVMVMVQDKSLWDIPPQAPRFGGDKDILAMKWLLGRAGGAQERRQSDLRSCREVEGKNLFSRNRINGLKVKEGEPLTITNEELIAWGGWGAGGGGGLRLDITSSGRTSSGEG